MRFCGHPPGSLFLSGLVLVFGGSPASEAEDPEIEIIHLEVGNGDPKAASKWLRRLVEIRTELVGASDDPGEAAYVRDTGRCRRQSVAIWKALVKPSSYNVESTAKAALAGGARQGPEEPPRDGRFAEVFIRDPSGTRVDLSEQGWQTQVVD